jgi:hypothetical protein
MIQVIIILLALSVVAANAVIWRRARNERCKS